MPARRLKQRIAPEIPEILTSEPIPREFNAAKTCGAGTLGVTVDIHCRTVGIIASELMDLLGKWGKYIPEGSELIAALHDIGKKSPAFQSHIRRVSGMEYESVPGYDSTLTYSRESHAFHALVSQASYSLESGLSNDYYSAVAYILGAHHGFISSAVPSDLKEYPDELGGSRWEADRKRLMDFLAEYFCTKVPHIEESDYLTKQLVLGLVITADWIGSGHPFSEMTLDTDVSDRALRHMIRSALTEIGIGLPSVNPGMSFTDIFPFSPNASQSALIDAVVKSGEGHHYILESTMGSGKTEAAFYSAYRLISEGKNSGMYFAMPSQVTSNAVFFRMTEFLKKIGVEKGSLIHSNASWVDTGMPRDWFSGTKRGILDRFGTGTVDQALMSVISVRHNAVRLFGLLGKVVILDEVHSYDRYTQWIMRELVDILKRMGCTVIMLSATLDSGTKSMICGEEYSRRIPYPCVIGPRGIKKIPQGKVRTIQLTFCPEEDIMMKRATDAASRGAKVIWFRNTVQSAQDLYCSIPAGKYRKGLIHSRFTVSDRLSNESAWLDELGKKKIKSRRKSGGCILVGTQVLEQSLDIDADLMLSDIAPMDSIIQRMGRLFRHTGAWRPKCIRRPEFIIGTSRFSSADSMDFGYSDLVYDRYLMTRTIKTLSGVNSVRIPSDLRRLIENTYSDVKENSSRMNTWKTLYVNETDKLINKAKCIKSAAYTSGDDIAQTRYMEYPTYSMLLVRKISESSATLMDGTVIEPGEHPDRRLVMTTHMSVLNTTRLKRMPPFDERYSWLSDYIWIGSDGNRTLLIGVVGRSGEVNSTTGVKLGSYGKLGLLKA